jgi:hypothetical protein
MHNFPFNSAGRISGLSNSRGMGVLPVSKSAQQARQHDVLFFKNTCKEKIKSPISP